MTIFFPHSSNTGLQIHNLQSNSKTLHVYMMLMARNWHKGRVHVCELAAVKLPLASKNCPTIKQSLAQTIYPFSSFEGSMSLFALHEGIFYSHAGIAKIISVAGYHCQVVNQRNRSDLLIYRMCGMGRHQSPPHLGAFFVEG